MHQDQTDHASNAGLIKLAYELVIEPSKLFELDRILDERVRENAKRGGALLDGSDDQLKSLSPYFDSALELFEKDALTSIQSARLKTRLIGAFSLSIDETGTILEIGDDAQNAIKLKSGDTLKQRLAKLKDGKKQQIPSPSASDTVSPILDIDEPESGKTGRYVVEWDTEDPDGIVGHVRRLNMVWDEYSGRAFAERLSLTAAEHAICRSIVTGQSLRQLSQDRGRSIGTVRNQLKALLAKLDLNSQTELVCLYAGFSKLSQLRPPSQGRPFRNDPERSFDILKPREGVTLAVDSWGNAASRPVIYLHPVIGGTYISDGIKKVFKRSNLRLIMPWRPFFGDTKVPGEMDALIENYSNALIDLLDQAKIQSCPIIAANGAAPYGFDFAKRYPDRCAGLIVAAGTLPVRGNESLKEMTPPQRVPYYLSAHAPGILRFYLRSLVGKIEAGYEVAYARNFFQGSPSDIAFAESDDFLECAREAMSYSFLEGPEAVMSEFFINARDWSHLATDLKVDTHLIYGAEELQHPEHRVRSFAEMLEDPTVQIVPNAGSMVFFQRPDLFADAIAEM
ncbi:MAG: alpha/beta hydrolase [Pseudomonadota bacterium]